MNRIIGECEHIHKSDNELEDLKKKLKQTEDYTEEKMRDEKKMMRKKK